MNNVIHVFAGPSLPSTAWPRGEGFMFHGPAMQGDVHSLTAGRPFAIGIIDGYFERVPSVWHKEVLWALSEGVHVFGAASMGALRAAELSDFGMVGVGAIYEAFADGRLTDDDEVAIVHADAEHDYRPLSVAMVNVRATLAAAEREGVLSAELASDLERAVKATFYPERSYARLLDLARQRTSDGDARRLAAWLEDPRNRVDQKQVDALQMLRALQALRVAAPGPKAVPWTFMHTDAWEQVRRNLLARAAVASPVRPEGIGQFASLAALPADEALLNLAHLRLLAAEAGRRDGYIPEPHLLASLVAEFCRANQLPDQGALESFLARQGLTYGDFERLIRDEACARRSRLMLGGALSHPLRDLLLMRGGHPAAERS